MRSRPPALKQAPPLRQTLGELVLYLRLADVALHRGRRLQAQHWLDGARARLLTALCQRHGLDPFDGRGFDNLPAEVLADLGPALDYGTAAGQLRAGLACLATMAHGAASDALIPPPALRYLDCLAAR